MTRYLIKVYNHRKELDGTDVSTLVNAFDKEFENFDQATEYCIEMIVNMNKMRVDEDEIFKYSLTDDERALELCDFFEKCLKHAVNMVAENPRYASLYNDNISSPEELQEKLEEFYNGEESEQYRLGYDDGKKFYESSSPFEKRNIEWKSEEYQKGFNDGFNTTLNREYFDGI